MKKLKKFVTLNVNSSRGDSYCMVEAHCLSDAITHSECYYGGKVISAKEGWLCPNALDKLDIHIPLENSLRSHRKTENILYSELTHALKTVNVFEGKTVLTLRFKTTDLF